MQEVYVGGDEESVILAKNVPDKGLGPGCSLVQCTHLSVLGSSLLVIARATNLLLAGDLQIISHETSQYVFISINSILDLSLCDLSWYLVDI